MSYVVVRSSGKQLKFNYIDAARAIQSLQQNSVIYHFEDGAKLPNKGKTPIILEGQWREISENSN